MLFPTVFAWTSFNCFENDTAVLVSYQPVTANTDALQIRVHVPNAYPNMWVGVGFSATGSMLGSRAMVAVINDTLNVYQYEVEIQGRLIYRYPVETQPNSTSIGISQTYDKRGLIYYFQRPILENLDSVPQIFSNGTSNYIMCAHGNVKDGKIYQHGPNKTVVAVDFTH